MSKTEHDINKNIYKRVNLMGVLSLGKEGFMSQKVELQLIIYKNLRTSVIIILLIKRTKVERPKVLKFLVS